MFNPIQQGPEVKKMYTDAREADLERRAEEHRAMPASASRVRRMINRLRRRPNPSTER
jgi:hypothetical protein